MGSSGKIVHLPINSMATLLQHFWRTNTQSSFVACSFIQSSAMYLFLQTHRMTMKLSGVQCRPFQHKDFTV